MKNLLNPSLVRQSLAGHSWMGLLVGVLMYLVCLSGTLAVFYEEFERWEQPSAEEYRDFDPVAIEAGYTALLNSGVEVTDHMYVALPSQGIPRVTVSSELEGRFVNRDGTLGEESAHEWTHLLLNLHLYLHLPITWGMILVSALGALLVGLIVSGFLAHPRIFKDAFTLRLKGSQRLEQVDIHNRLSVWGAPFHLIIAVTGAWFGLVMPLGALLAMTIGSTPEEVTALVFGDEPVLEQRIEKPAIANALLQMPEVAEGAQPLFMTIHGAGTPQQFMEIGGLHEDRLIYSENYRFDSAGNYLGKTGFSDGDAGKQAMYSIYRIHFGAFGGFFVKVIYAVLGLALTVVSVTGINIWLARRTRRDWINRAWPALVWGTPAALALTITTQAVLLIPSTGLMWLVLVIAVAYGLLQSDERHIRWQLQALTAVLLVVAVIAHALRFGGAALGPAALGVNLCWLASALVLGWFAQRQWSAQRQTVQTAQVAVAGPG